MRTRPLLLILALGAALAGCGTAPTKTADKDDGTVTPPYKGGGYYKDDGPGANPPANLADIPDPAPKWEPLHRYANDRYKVMGKEYVPLSADKAYKSKGLASWYGRKFHGKPTSSGEPYDMYAMSAAHPTLPLPSYAKVTNLENGRSVIVRVNDRGPFHEGRIIDLSYTAAYKLDILKGVTPVEVESVLPDTPAPSSFVAQAADDFNPLAVPAPSMATEPAVAPPQVGKAIYLQLGAFAKPETADGVLNRASAILSRGFPGVLRIESNGLYKVQAGPFANTEDADRAAGRVQSELGIKAYKVAAGGTAASPAAASQPAAQPVPLPVILTDNPGPGLYLQLGAVSSPDAAEALAGRVQSRYGDDLPGLARVSAGTLYKIQAGPFADSAAADKLAAAYQQDFGVRPYRLVR
ncbi:MAG: septal ring lytic transglycosylase RlpA family protein [Pseudomonadota bacterium]